MKDMHLGGADQAAVSSYVLLLLLWQWHLNGILMLPQQPGDFEPGHAVAGDKGG